MVTKENFVFRVNVHVEILEITTHIVGSRLIMIKCGLHNCYNTSNQAKNIFVKKLVSYLNLGNRHTCK